MADTRDAILVKLEAQVAYNERMLADLNEIVTTQQQEVTLLKGELQLLGQQVQRLAEREA